VRRLILVRFVRIENAAADWDSRQKNEIPQPNHAPVIAEEFQLGGNDGRAEMTQVAGDAEDLVTSEQQVVINVP
jgi:hypothetical protein